MIFMKKIRLKIVTPEKIVLADEVNQVTLNTVMGQITVLPNHIPLVSSLVPGEVMVKKDGSEEDWMAISGGFVEVTPNNVTVLADTAEYAEDIDEARAEEARTKAEELLREKVADEADYAMLAAKLRKELTRLKVARKRRLG